VKRAAVLLIALVWLAGCGDDGAGADATPVDRCLVDGVVDLEGDMCEQLDTYGLFDDANAQDPADGVMPYDLNTALFSDYAVKYRFLRFPEGETFAWTDPESFDFPVGTIIVKTFAYLADVREPDGARDLLETRLLIRTSEEWTGASYIYDETDTVASLEIAGDTIHAEWIDAAGEPAENEYVVPNKNQCKNCHEEHLDVISPIGPKARHINRDGQLEALIDGGWLTGAPADPLTWPKAPVFDDDTTGTLDERARTWLDINCAHCHNPDGAARTSGLDLRATQVDPFEFGVCKPPVAAGGGSGGRQYTIVPGDPDGSIMVFRLESTEADIKMPELGRNLVHAESLTLIRDWITAMTGTCK
jgi:uncharacterized repeat protein (TIGR03806 family)